MFITKWTAYHAATGEKVCRYIVRYPVVGTAQSTLPGKLHPLTDLFIPMPF